MDKSVLVSISGMQFDSENDDAIEIITTGDYYKKNNKHYVVFDEVLDGTDIVTKNVVYFNDSVLDLKRKGAVNVHMIFDREKKTLSNYATPFGNLVIGIDTADVKVDETDNHISVNVDYALDINYEFLTDCKLKLDISERKSQ